MSDFLKIFQGLDKTAFIEFVVRFVFNFAAIYVLAKKIYYPVGKRSNILFSLLMINVVIFTVCFVLQSAQLSIGFAFGIFAVFSILRYRTSTVPIKEMTYIFISISLAIFNALTNIYTGYGIALFVNFAFLFIAYIFEKKFVRNEVSKTVVYEKIDLIKPENYEKMLADLKERTGLPIERAEIRSVDFSRDVARIRIFYFDSGTDED